MKFIKKEKVIKTFESFIGGSPISSKYGEYDNLSKANDGVDLSTKNRILDVENFNEWLTNDFSGYGYQKGAPGLIGRVDKLSEAMIVSYFLDQGVECTNQEINDFKNKISNFWRK